MTIPFETHEVLNQPPPLAGYDLFGTDRALREAVVREGAEWALDELGAFGRQLGQAETIEAGRLANAYPPVPHLFDRYGRRIDEVEFHPAWHELMALVDRGRPPYPALGRTQAGRPCRPRRRCHHDGAGRGRRAVPDHHDLWRRPRAARRRRRSRPNGCRGSIRANTTSACIPAAEKTGALMGMGMTEKQGGSDLRANTTRAEPVDDAGDLSARRP